MWLNSGLYMWQQVKALVWSRDETEITLSQEEGKKKSVKWNMGELPAVVTPTGLWGVVVDGIDFYSLDWCHEISDFTVLVLVWNKKKKKTDSDEERRVCL